MKIKEIFIPVIPLTEELAGKELRIVDHLNLTGSSPRNIGFIPVTELYIYESNNENAGIGDGEQCLEGTAAERASSRLRRMNDRSVLLVYQDHEDDENAGIGVRQQCLQG